MTDKSNSVNVRKRITVILLMTLVIADAVFIFVNSSLDADKSSNESGKVTHIVISVFHPEYDSLSEEEKTAVFSEVSSVVRQIAHFAEFVPLGLFGTLLVFVLAEKNEKRKFYVIGTFALCAAYAVTDEIHQHFTDGRAAEAVDVLTDSLGSLCGVVIALALYGIANAVRRSKINKRI